MKTYGIPKKQLLQVIKAPKVDSNVLVGDLVQVTQANDTIDNIIIKAFVRQYGTSVNLGSSSNKGQLTSVALTNNKHLVFYDGKVRLATIDGYNVTFGNATTVGNSLYGDGIYPYRAVRISDNTAVFLWTYSGNYQIAVIQENNGTLSVGSPATISCATTPSYYDMIYLGDNKLIIGYIATNTTYQCALVTINGTSVTIVSYSSVITVSNAQKYIKLSNISSSDFLVLLATNGAIYKGQVDANNNITLTFMNNYVAPAWLGNVSNIISINDNKYVSMVEDSATNYIYLIPFTSISGVITIGTIFSVSSAAAGRIVYLDTDKFVFAYLYAGSTLRTSVCTVDNNLVITKGTDYTPFAGYSFSERPRIICPTTSKVIIMAIYLSNLYVIAGAISGTTISYGSSVSMASSNSGYNYQYSDLVKIRNEHYLLAYSDPNNGSNIMLRVFYCPNSGTSITLYSPVNSSISITSIFLKYLSDNKVLLVRNGSAYIVNVTNTTPSISSSQTFAYQPSGDAYSGGYNEVLPLSSTTLLVSQAANQGLKLAIVSFENDSLVEISSATLNFPQASVWSAYGRATPMCFKFGSQTEGIVMCAEARPIIFSITNNTISLTDTGVNLRGYSAFPNDFALIKKRDSFLIFCSITNNGVEAVEYKILENKTYPRTYEQAPLPANCPNTYAYISNNNMLKFVYMSNATYPCPIKLLGVQLDNNNNKVQTVFNESIDDTLLTGDNFCLSPIDENQYMYLLFYWRSNNLYATVVYLGDYYKQQKTGRAYIGVWTGQYVSPLGTVANVFSNLKLGQTYYMDFNNRGITPIYNAPYGYSMLVGVAVSSTGLLLLKEIQGLSLTRQVLEVGSSSTNYFTFDGGLLIKKETS